MLKNWLMGHFLVQNNTFWSFYRISSLGFSEIVTEMHWEMVKSDSLDF